MKKNYKRLIAVIGLISMLFALPGCASKEEGNKKSNIDYDYTKTNELSGQFELQICTSGYGAEAWEEIIADFEELYPELDVVAYLDSNINKKMQNRWIQGTPPDFVLLSGPNIPILTYIEEGKFMDLSSFFDAATLLDSDKLLKDHIKESYLTEYDGKVYKLPLSLTTYGMWYDVPYVEQLGLTMPSNFDELMNFAKEAKNKGKDTVIYPGTSSHYLTEALIFPALAAYGQEYFDRIVGATDTEAFTDERFVDVLTRFKQFADAGFISEGTVALNHTQSQMQWLSHKAIMIPNGNWLESEMKKDIPDDFKMRYAPGMLNLADQPKTVVTSAMSMAVSAEGDNTEAALEFMRFLYQDENMVKIAEMTSSPVATQTDMAGAEISEAGSYLQTVLNDPEVTIVTQNLTWGTVDAVFNDCVNQIVLGKMDVKQAVDAIVQAVEKKNSGL